MRLLSSLDLNVASTNKLSQNKRSFLCMISLVKVGAIYIGNCASRMKYLVDLAHPWAALHTPLPFSS